MGTPSVETSVAGQREATVSDVSSTFSRTSRRASSVSPGETGTGSQDSEMLSREAAIEAAKEAAKKVRRKKKRTASSTSLASNTFQELYRLTGEVLGQGAYASVQTCVNLYTEVEYAVKIIDKTVPTH